MHLSVVSFVLSFCLLVEEKPVALSALNWTRLACLRRGLSLKRLGKCSMANQGLKYRFGLCNWTGAGGIIPKERCRVTV